MFEVIKNTHSGADQHMKTAFRTARFKFNANAGMFFEEYSEVANKYMMHTIRPSRMDNDAETPYLDAILISPLNPFRWYHDTGFSATSAKDNNIAVCYTREEYSVNAKPSEEVFYKQAARCGDCKHFTGVVENGKKKTGAACKFRNTAFLILDKYPDILMDFNMPSVSYLQAGREDNNLSQPLPLKKLIASAKEVLQTSVGTMYVVRMIPTIVNNGVKVVRFEERKFIKDSNIPLQEFITTNSDAIREYITYNINQPIPTKKEIVNG